MRKPLILLTLLILLKRCDFPINQRFGFVESVVSMVAKGVQASAVITGEGGLGKTFTVLKVLKEEGFQDLNDAEIGAKNLFYSN